MYINPLFVGIFGTLFVETVILVIVSILKGKK